MVQPYGDDFGGNFAPDEVSASAAQAAAISGADSKFISMFFCNNRVLQNRWCAKAEEFTGTVMATWGNDDKADYPNAFAQGEQIAAMVRVLVAVI